MKASKQAPSLLLVEVVSNRNKLICLGSQLVDFQFLEFLHFSAENWKRELVSTLQCGRAIPEKKLLRTCNFYGLLKKELVEIPGTEMPTFKNQMRVKQEFSEPATHLLLAPRVDSMGENPEIFSHLALQYCTGRSFFWMN